MRRSAALLCTALLLVCAGCKGSHQSASHAALKQSSGGAPKATPVTVRPVQRLTMKVKVSAPGRTDALEQQTVNAPFNCRLVTLSVSDGDFVRDHQKIGEVVSQNSEAAVVGARSMLRDAHTPQARRDAQQALKIAKQNVVGRALHAPEAGVVVSHKASEGETLSRGSVIVNIAALDSFVFIAQATQTDLSRIKPGQEATVELTAFSSPMHGKVHAILPAASFHSLTTPVRIDLSHASKLTTIGMFGTADIVVGDHANVIAVPQAAVLRNDITGVSRVALVSNGKAHWKNVKPGITQNGLVEIKSAPFQAGDEVIVSGQVGLPDNAPVQASVGKAPQPTSPVAQPRNSGSQGSSQTPSAAGAAGAGSGSGSGASGPMYPGEQSPGGNGAASGQGSHGASSSRGTATSPGSGGQR